jgi:hypothetical protein
VVILKTHDNGNLALFTGLELQDQPELLVQADRVLMLAVPLEFLEVKRLHHSEVVLVGGIPDELHAHPKCPDQIVGKSAGEIGLLVNPFQCLVGMPKKHCVSPFH